MASVNAPNARQNMGGAAQAAAVGNVTRATVRNWLLQGLIRGERTGNGRYRYNLDDCAAMTISYPRDNVDERIDELVAGAPEFTAGQINRIRLLLNAVPQRSTPTSA
jgi:hypothetical protein